MKSFEMRLGDYFLVLAILSATINLNQSQTFEKCSSAEITDADRTLQTLNGKIKGECFNVPVSYSNSSEISYEIFSWRSIPYAEPPLASKRFLKPEPIKSWSDVREGTSWPKSCMQTYSLGANQDISEDCLYLNVFTQRNAYLNREQELKPVMVWIHGGSFLNGGSADDLYEPSTLVAAGDVIVVTINYRLGLFGSMFIEGITSNAALNDQQLALKWIHDNAKQFGGDKNRITIFGESAGAWSVGFNLFMESSWPYFTNAILESGGPTGSKAQPYKLHTPTSATYIRKQYTDAFCNQTTDSELLKCLQNLESEKVLNISSQLPLVTFVQDGELFTDSIDQLLMDGKHKKCDIITGFNANEYGLFHALENLTRNVTHEEYIARLKSWLDSYKIDYDTLNIEYLGMNDIENANIDFYDALNRIISDSHFKCQAFGLAEGFTVNNQKAFVYEFEFQNLEHSLVDLDYAVHADEIVYVFAGPLSNRTVTYSTEDKRFTEQLVTYWTNFAKYNDPNHSDGLAKVSLWTPFARQSDNLDKLTANEKMDVGRYIWFLNEKTRMVSGFSDYKCDYWGQTRDSTSISSSSGKINVGSWITIFVFLLSFNRF